MTTLIFGVGFGVFIILILWLSAGIISLISLRTKKKITFATLSIVGIITLALLTVSRRSENPDIDNEKVSSQPYDRLFIWRTLLTIILAVSSLIAFVAYIRFELMRPMKAVRIRNWIL